MGRSIHHIATSYDGVRVAVAEAHRSVYVWDLAARRRISTIDTTMDFGGNRLAINRSGSVCVAGAYSTHGVAAYACDSGAEVWRRSDIKQVQQVIIDPHDDRVYCGVEGGSLRVLRLRDGRDAGSLPAVTAVAVSPHSPVRIHLGASRDDVVYSGRRRLGSFAGESFAVLATAFSPDSVCISEAGGPVRCFALPSLREVWRYSSPEGHHVLTVAWCEEAGSFFGLEWCYEDGGPQRLLQLDVRSRLISKIGEPTNAEFCWYGNALLTSDGRLLRVSTGRLHAKLAVTR